MAHQTIEIGTARVRIRRTTIGGYRGWVWEWQPISETRDVWSDANGPEASRAEAEAFARDVVGPSWGE